VIAVGELDVEEVLDGVRGIRDADDDCGPGATATSFPLVDEGVRASPFARAILGSFGLLEN